MAINENALGPDHPAVARTAGHLGELYVALGQMALARSYFERALHIDELVYGPNHIAVFNRLNQLGRVLKETGDFDAARKCLHRAADILAAAKGPGSAAAGATPPAHPDGTPAGTGADVRRAGAACRHAAGVPRCWGGFADAEGGRRREQLTNAEVRPPSHRYAGERAGERGERCGGALCVVRAIWRSHVILS